MKKRTLLLCFLLFTSFAFACSCIGKSKMKNELKQTAVVFVGKILSMEIQRFDDSIYVEPLLRKAVYKVLVTEKLKGRFVSDTVTIYTGLGHGDCGVQFAIGESYILYSNYEDNHFNGEKVTPFLTTNICTRTQRFDEEEYKRIRKYAKRKGYC